MFRLESSPRTAHVYQSELRFFYDPVFILDAVTARNDIFCKVSLTKECTNELLPVK